MLDQLLANLAPHYCYSCHKIGAGLCENCKYDIASEPFSQCVACLRPTVAMALCGAHRLPYQKAWVVGERREVLDTLIDRYKFGHERANHRQLADLLGAVVPLLPAETVVTNVPTIQRHIRQRGFDHAALIARRFARQRGLAYRPTLRRQTNTTQFGASKAERERQACEAFAPRTDLEAERPYLLIDDVFTTGATLRYAAEQLARAGAKDIWIAVLARQPEQ